MATVKLEVVFTGDLKERTDAVKNLEKYGIEIEVEDDDVLIAHNYGGNWKYLGPPKPPSASQATSRKGKKRPGRR